MNLTTLIADPHYYQSCKITFSIVLLEASLVMYQPIQPRSPLETMPTMYDLPSELVGESGLPDEFHLIQSALLTETYQPIDYLPEEILLASDLNLYYDPRHTQWYKRPDWYMVLDLPKANQK